MAGVQAQKPAPVKVAIKNGAGEDVGSATFKTVKKGVQVKKLLKGSPPPPTIVLIDNDDLSFTVQGEDSQDQPVDISALCTLDVVSNNLPVMTVDPPVGQTDVEHALAPGSASLALTETFNDGVTAPLILDWPQTVATGGPTGLIVTPGTPTVRP